MPTWEYLTAPLLVHNTKMILDTFGADGWELVQVLPGPTGEQLVAYFKAAQDLMTTPGTSHSARLEALGLVLPPVAAPLAAYVPAVREGELVFTSGQLPTREGRLVLTGLVGEGAAAEVTPDQAKQLAEVCALNALAAAASVAGGLDAIARVLKVVGFVASAPGFTGQPMVVNGASELIGAVLGDAGVHARSAVGVASLPLGAPVEVELICLVR